MPTQPAINNPMNPTQPTAPASMATPLPWHVGMKPGPIIYGPQGEQIADLTGALSFNAGPNAQFIVRACNSHAQLVRLLQLVADSDVVGLPRDPVGNLPLRRAIRAALTAAKE